MHNPFFYSYEDMYRSYFPQGQIENPFKAQTFLKNAENMAFESNQAPKLKVEEPPLAPKQEFLQENNEYQYYENYPICGENYRSLDHDRIHYDNNIYVPYEHPGEINDYNQQYFYPQYPFYQNYEIYEPNPRQENQENSGRNQKQKKKCVFRPKKNVQSNICNQIFSFMINKKKCKDQIQFLCKKNYRKIAAFFEYGQVLAKYKRKYLSRKNIADYCIENNNSRDYDQEIKSKGKQGILGLKEFKHLLSLLAIHFLRQKGDLSILTSNRLSSQLRVEHLERRREILDHVVQSLKVCTEE